MAILAGLVALGSPRVDEVLATVNIPYEEWEVLYRERRDRAQRRPGV